MIFRVIQTRPLVADTALVTALNVPPLSTSTSCLPPALTSLPSTQRQSNAASWVDCAIATISVRRLEEQDTSNMFVTVVDM